MTTTAGGIDTAARVSEALCEEAVHAINEGQIRVDEVLELGCFHPEHLTMTTLGVACERFGLDAADLLR